MTRSLIPALLPALLLSGLLTAGCEGGAGASGDRVDVVAGENVWGDIARQIGGSHVRVTSIVKDPDTDPHEYESDPGDAAALAGADLVIENGAGYDAFLGKLLSAAGGHPTVIDVADLVGATQDGVNPHLWYSPTYVDSAAAEIEERLADTDPSHAADFATNLLSFEKSYAPYAATIAEIKEKYAGEPISYTERVPGYLVDAAGLRLGTPATFSQAVEDDADPSPKDTADFDAAITGRRVDVLLYNDQVVDAQTTKIKQLATVAQVPIVGVSETLPPSYPTFQAWQIAQARALLMALQR